MKYTNRRGFIGVRPDGCIILQSCAYYAGDSRRWISRNLSTSGSECHWASFYADGYRVVRCEITPAGRAALEQEGK